MTVGIFYVHPTVDQATYQHQARRFAETYQQNPPGEYPHELHVIVNGKKYPALKRIFEPLPVTFWEHNNDGKDIGAFQMAAARATGDVMVCFGAAIYFHRSGWLDWMMDAYLQCGPGLYGAWASHQPATHVRTTGFWLPPAMLNAYPRTVGNAQRYEFEHGRNNLTLWAIRSGFQALQVTWDGVFEDKDWHAVSRRKSLFRDQHSDLHGPR